MGKLFHFLPITFTTMFIGTLALTGFPFLAGYYSKDLIIETAYASSTFGFFIYLTGSIATFLTSFYSIRALYFVFFGKDSSLRKTIIPTIYESSIQMTGPMISLTILAIISGYILKDIFTGPSGLFLWGNSINISIYNSFLDHEYIPFLIKITPTLIGLCGLTISYIFFNNKFFYTLSLSQYSFINLTTQKFYIDHIYNSFLAKGTVLFGYIQYTIFDRGFLEKLGPFGLIELISFLMKKLNMQTGFIIHYLLLIISIIALFSIFSILNLIVGIPIFSIILLILFFI